MKKILPFINSRFRMALININNAGIEVIIKSLINKELLVEGSKLISEEILFNQKRRKIYEYILKNAGVYVNKITKELNINYHVIVWHLNVLLKFNYIRKERFENHDIYFDPKIEFEKVKIIYFLTYDKSKEIIDYLKKNEYTTQNQLSTDLKISSNTIKKYLKSLEEFKIITKNKISNNKSLYFLNENYF